MTASARNRMLGLVLFSAGVILAVILIRGSIVTEWGPDAVATSKERGDRIIGALEVYRQTTGRYPETLDLLVPTFLKEVEPPLAGTGQWVYRTTQDGQFFHIQFQGHGDHPKRYGRHSGSAQWTFDSGEF